MITLSLQTLGLAGVLMSVEPDREALAWHGDELREVVVVEGRNSLGVVSLEDKKWQTVTSPTK